MKVHWQEELNSLPTGKSDVVGFSRQHVTVNATASCLTFCTDELILTLMEMKRLHLVCVRIALHHKDKLFLLRYVVAQSVPIPVA
jgi:hypothetical protein